MTTETEHTAALDRAREQLLGLLGGRFNLGQPDPDGTPASESFQPFTDYLFRRVAELERYIGDPDHPWVTWETPYLELELDATDHWDLEAIDTDSHPDLKAAIGFSEEDLVDGEVPEERIREVAEEMVLLFTLAALTRGVVELREGAVPDLPQVFSLPPGLVAKLDKETGTREDRDGVVHGTPEAITARGRRVHELSEPRAIAPEGFWPVQPISPPTFAWPMPSGAVVRGGLIALVYPLVVQKDTRRAYFRVGVGLFFEGDGPETLSKEDQAAFWRHARESKLGLRSREGDRTRIIPPTEKFVALLERGMVRRDRQAAAIIQGLSAFGRLPRKWGRIRKWEDLKAAEVQSILEEHGEQAQDEVPGVRGALLVKRYTVEPETGTRRPEYHLTGPAERDLREREGPKGYREVRRDPDRVDREYLVKQVRAGGGYIEMAFSWYGQAGLLVEEERERIGHELAETAEGAGLFDDLDSEQRKRADQALGQLATLKDAQRLMEALQSWMGSTGENPVRVPAVELYVLFECEKDHHRLRRVRGALEALRRLDFRFKAAGVSAGVRGETRGSFVTEWAYKGRGAGRHGEGDFVVHLSEMAIGTLSVFETARGRIQNPGRALDWAKRTDKADRERMDYSKSWSSLRPYFDPAAGHTPSQKALHTWLEDQITRKGSNARKGHNARKVHHSASDAGDPRLYDRSFCPLLEQGRRYAGALGNHAKNPETGWKLKGRSQPATATGGAKTGGLLEKMGYELPPGRAASGREKVALQGLGDLVAVVEQALGGVLAGRYKGRWITPDQAAAMPTRELLEVAWMPFLPEDWTERMLRRIEEHHAGRRARGETDAVVFTTRDPEAYRQSLEDRGAARTERAESVGLAELRHRLRQVRTERGLSQGKVARLFGVSQKTLSNWELGPEGGGKAIPPALRPLVQRWMDTGTAPASEDLEKARQG